MRTTGSSVMKKVEKIHAWSGKKKARKAVFALLITAWSRYSIVPSLWLWSSITSGTVIHLRNEKRVERWVGFDSLYSQGPFLLVSAPLAYSLSFVILNRDRSFLLSLLGLRLCRIEIDAHHALSFPSPVSTSHPRPWAWCGWLLFKKRVKKASIWHISQYMKAQSPTII